MSPECREVVGTALLQKLFKFLNCEQLFGSRLRLQRATNAGKALGFFGFRGRK